MTRRQRKRVLLALAVLVVLGAAATLTFVLLRPATGRLETLIPLDDRRAVLAFRGDGDGPPYAALLDVDAGLVWRTELPRAPDTSWGSPTGSVAGDVVVLGLRDRFERSEQGLVGLSLADGALLWHTELGASDFSRTVGHWASGRYVVEHREVETMGTQPLELRATGVPDHRPDPWPENRRAVFALEPLGPGVELE
jgi:hypothetical protein